MGVNVSHFFIISYCLAPLFRERTVINNGLEKASDRY